jgi:hypothetical protein
MEMVERYPDKPWYWHEISKNPNLTFDFIEKYPDKDWDWTRISRHHNLNMEFVKSHPDKSWNWDYISYNQNLTMEIIQAHPDKPWNWDRISLNPNISMEIIEDNIDKINFNKLSQNKLLYCGETTLQYYKERKEQTIKQTLEIKEELLSIAMHPDRVLDWCFSNEERNELASRWLY